MNAGEIIRQVEEDAAEWLEHADNPAALVAGVLASKIVSLNNYINFLEKRLRHDSSSTTRVN